MKKQLIILACVGTLAVFGTGCAGLTAGIKGAHATVSKTVDSAFTVVEKAAEAGEKIVGATKDGAVATVTPVVTSTP